MAVIFNKEDAPGQHGHLELMAMTVRMHVETQRWWCAFYIYQLTEFDAAYSYS
jgi:hypothetical protein